MTHHITIPEGKVAVLLDRQLATELVSLYRTLGSGKLPRREDLPAVQNIAKEAWFDTFIALDNSGSLDSFLTPLMHKEA